MVVDHGISPYGHTVNRSQSRVLRTIGFVEIYGSDIYVRLALKCWGPLTHQQSDLIAEYIN